MAVFSYSHEIAQILLHIFFQGSFHPNIPDLGHFSLEMTVFSYSQQNDGSERMEFFGKIEAQLSIHRIDKNTCNTPHGDTF